MKKTRIEMSTDDGRIMMGTADESGSLRYGEVFIQYSADIDHPQAEMLILEGPVVIAKNPCFHPGDMRKFMAVNKPQLKHMIDCVVFPTQGSRPHPDEMSGSDLDGDMYFVCWHSRLLPPGENKEPMNYEPKPKQVLVRPVTESDMIDFIGSYINGDKVGVIANSHLAHADGQESGIFSQQCLNLAQMHSDAVDFPKTGFSVKIPFELRPRKYPHYMLKRDKPTYRSEHVLGKLYDQCNSIMSNRGENADNMETGVDDRFLVPGYENYLSTARKIHDYYRQNVLRLKSEYGITTEAEVITGRIITLKKQSRGTLQQEHVEIAEIVNIRLKTIRAKVKDMFFQAVGNQSNENSVELSRLASAVYFVTYTDQEEDKTCLSLPWVFAEHLLSARRLIANPETASSTLPMPSQRSVLHQLSDEIVDFKQSDGMLQERSRVQRIKAFQRLSGIISPLSNVEVVLSVFGSHATGLDDTRSSLDVLIRLKSYKMTQKIFGQITGLLRREYNLPRQRPLMLGMKPIIVMDSVNEVTICLYTDETCIRRTVYIISAVVNNAWIFPVLQTVLAWAKQNKITGRDRASTMTVEQLIVLFLSYLLQNVADYQSVGTEDKSRVMDLILDNHFINCRASICSHAKKLEVSEENKNRYCYGDDRYADVILNFLNRCSRLQGEVLKEVVDPACNDDGTKLFALKELQYHRLAERMLKAYHTLAQRGHFVDLVGGSKLSDERLVMEIPLQVCRRILFAEKSYAEKLKRESKADVVTIRRRPFRDSLAGLILEAWGSLQSLHLINDFINDEAKVKPSLLAPGSSFLVMENAKMAVFKSCNSDSARIVFDSYSGPCQPSHDRFVRHIPRLLDASPENYSFSQEKFAERSMQQLNSVGADYDDNIHGNMRAVISYGTFYVVNCSIQEPLPATEFDALLASGSASNSAAIHSDPVHPRSRGRGRGRWRGRGGSYMPSERNSHIRTSFIPTGNPHIDGEHLQDFLKNNGFVLTEETVDYHVSLKLLISGQQLKMDSVVVLDENFNLRYVIMPDIKWLCIDIVSADKDSKYRPYDCRFKIHSRIKRTVQELRRETEDFADILAHHQTMLRRTADEVYGVNPDYLSRIRFMRKKHTKVYQLAANQYAACADPFLYGMTIKVNYGTEYSRPSQIGTFQNVERNRVEVTAVPELPDLRDEDKMRTFFNRTWEFAEELGSILQ